MESLCLLPALALSLSLPFVSLTMFFQRRLSPPEALRQNKVSEQLRIPTESGEPLPSSGCRSFLVATFRFLSKLFSNTTLPPEALRQNKVSEQLRVPEEVETSSPSNSWRSFLATTFRLHSNPTPFETSPLPPFFSCLFFFSCASFVSSCCFFVSCAPFLFVLCPCAMERRVPRSLGNPFASEVLQLLSPLVQVFAKPLEGLAITHLIVHVLLYLQHSGCKLLWGFMEGALQKLCREESAHV